MADDTDAPRHDAASYQPPRAVVGWLHNVLPHGIELKVQSAASAEALEREEVETSRFVLTRNQALLLASFLLKATGHSPADVPDAPRSRWARWLGLRR